MIDITTYLTTQMANGNFQLMMIGASFIGGILASISPCSLAMLPIVIGYIGGYNKQNNLKTFLQLISFITGSGIIFSIIGIICALTGKVFISVIGGYFIVFVSSLILVMGLNLSGILEINIPTVINKIPSNSNNSVYLYPMLLGGVFALGGTPCSTPILAGIMSFASITNNILLSIIMLFAFALGEGVILILAGMFTNIIKNLGGVMNYSQIIIKLCGFLLILISFYLFYKTFSPFFL